MKSKKLISLLCAAAMSASAFAGLTVTASAADDLFTLTDFTAADISQSSGGTDSGKWNYANSKQLVTVENDDKGTYLQSTITAGEGSTYDTTYTLPTAITATNYVLEFDTSIHWSNGMGRPGRMNQIAFTDSNAANDPRDYAGKGTGAVYSSGIATSLNSRDGIEGLIVNDLAKKASDPIVETAINVADDEWVRVQSVVNGDKANITVINAAGRKIIDNEEYAVDANGISAIHLIPGRGDKESGQGVVSLDNVHIYTGEARELTVDGLRGEATIATPIPAPETVSGAAATLSAPDTAVAPKNISFNDSTLGEKFISIQDAAQDPVEIVDGVKVAVGSRTGGDGSTYASIVEPIKGDKALKLAGASFATQLRGPIVSLDDNLDISSSTDTTAVMAFSVYLSKIDTIKGSPRFWLLDNTTNTAGDSTARDVLAVITSEDIGNETDGYKYKSGSRNIGIQVSDGEWHTVVVTVSNDAYRIFIDGNYKDESNKLAPTLVNKDGVGTGSGNMKAVTHLPLIAIENASDGSSAFSQILLDNILTYKVTGDLKAERLPSIGSAPTPAPIPAKVTMSVDETANTVTLTSDKDTNAVLVQASYRTDNTLDSVKKVVNLELKANEAKLVPATDLATFTTNDKIMVWDSLKTMTPLANACTVKNGAAQATAKPAPTEAPTEAPAETPATTDAPTTEPTEAPAETVAPTDTPAPTATAVPTYAVSGTVDAGVKSVTLTDKAEAENIITGKIEDTTVTFTGVKAGTYTVSAVAASGKDIYTIKVGDTETTEVTVTDANVTNLAVTSKDEAVLPYADGTNTYDTEGAANSFVDYSRVTVSIADGVNGNTTKVQNLKTGNGSSGAGYNPYTVAFPAKGEAVATSFDISIPTRNAWVSVRGTQPGTNDRNNNAAGRIFTIGAEGSAVIKIYSGADVVDEITGTDIITKWYHVDAVVNNTTKKVAIKVYDYKANNNYTKETALYDKTVDFRDNTVAGVVAMDYHSNTANANMQIDNLYINDPSYVTPINVTATDVTVDKAQVVKDDVITITPTVPAGKKLSAVKVNGTAVTAVDGKYTYTVTGEESAIAVTADFVRADVDNVVVSSTNTDVQIGQKGTYKATVYADADKKIDITKDSAITWSVESATEGVSLADGTVMAQDGTLTVAADQAVGKLTVKATAVKDIASSDDTDANKVVGTFEVNVIAEKSFQVVAATVENGKVAFKVGDTENATSFKESETLEIVPTANAGYELDSVSYKLTSAEDDTYTTVTATEGKYTVAGNAIAGDITVKVTFKAINYKITNNTVAENGNSIAIRIGDTEAATAIVGQTITIVPTIANGYKLKSISVKNGNTDVTVTNNTFTMPAADVTVEATFEEWNGIYYSQDFESYADTDAVKADWVSASYPAGVTLVTGDTTYGQYLSMDDGTQNGRGVRVTLPASAEVTGQYKVSFDANVKKGNIANRTESSISIGGKDAKTANTNSTFGSGYLFEMVVANDTGIATVSGMTENNTFTPTDATWYHYDLTVDTEAKTVAVVITAKDEAATQLFSGTATINGNGVLKYIQLVGGKAYGKVLIDNIKVTAPWYTDASSGTEDGTGTEA